LVAASTDRLRLDLALVARGLVASRARARDVIKRGLVMVDGAVSTKPAQEITPHQSVTLNGDAASYVSRGAEKLVAALDRFGLDARGRVALDIGASTGGFTQILLEHGAARVYAVDVGSDQLHESLKHDDRVVSLESFDARRLDKTVVPEPVTALVADVSFISLTKVMPAALTLAFSGAWLVALVKPQFELEPGDIGKGGIVRDAAARDTALEKITRWVGTQPGWRVLGSMPSPIAGGSGNQEFLVAARFDG
jgi:23S rRNA (cytidine1920-2'-O)/16S rRNA (cytidine1409-2'-O)-methyltransferase